MSTESAPAQGPAPVDLVDQVAALSPGSSAHSVRHRRDKVAAATQASYDALFDANLPGLTLAERLMVALYACRLTMMPALVWHYKDRLAALPASEFPASMQSAQSPSAQTSRDSETSLQAEWLRALEFGNPEKFAGTRLAAILSFARVLTLEPIAGDRAKLLSLPAAGLSTPEVVTLAQLIAFVSYQTRLVVGLTALNAATPSAAGAKS